MFKVIQLKIDPNNHKKKYENWKRRGCIKGISQFNSDLIVTYINDMEHGLNVARRGVIGYSRLNNLIHRMGVIVKGLEKLYSGKKITDVTDREVVAFFKMMRDGSIHTQKGGQYTSVPDYVNVFKAFWHWHQRVEAENGNTIKDITKYIDTSKIKESEFVYFTIDELRRMVNLARYRYRVMMWFMFDSGIRAPTELRNIKIGDLFEIEGSEIYQLNIRDEISKTFGRKIKLLLCSKLLREYIKGQGLCEEDYLFPICPRIVNQYLKRLAAKTLGDYKTKGGQRINEISMYDFRHSSACYWLPRYKNESALKYRFGWKRDDMVHHYTKLLGMQDTIVEDDLLIDSEAKTKLEKELEQERKTRELLQEQLQSHREELQIVREQMQQLISKVGILFLQSEKKDLPKIQEMWAEEFKNNSRNVLAARS